MLAKNECISWRQTGGCDPTGPWESQFDKTCDANIPPGASGYCQCKRNGVDITQGEKKCRTKTFRNCNEACNTGKLLDEIVLHHLLLMLTDMISLLCDLIFHLISGK